MYSGTISAGRPRRQTRRFSIFPLTVLGLIFCASLLFASGCARKETRNQSTPTSGSLIAYVAPAIKTVMEKGADQFNRLYPKANIIVLELNSRAIVDSMIYNCADNGYFDRALSIEESLAVARSRRHVSRFLLGSTVATWIVHPSNPITELDSAQVLGILKGEIKNWKALGGDNEEIRTYLPPLGDGAWAGLQEFFGNALTKVEAHYWPSDSLVLARTAEDVDALGFVGMAVYDARIKKIRWRNPILEASVPANIGMLQEGKYPFHIRFCYYTIGDKTDLASGFLSFLASNAGQRLIADSNYLPEMVPVRIVMLSPSTDQK